jgi:hypothetical protein
MTTAVNEKLEAQVARYTSCDNYQENQSANARCQVSQGTFAGTRGNGRVAKIEYANSYGTAALDLRRGAFGCHLAAERDRSLPTPLDAAMLTSKIGGKSGRFRLPRSSHADSPEGDDETFVQDCRCGCHGIDALAGRPGSAGAEIGRHP